MIGSRGLLDRMSDIELVEDVYNIRSEVINEMIGNQLDLRGSGFQFIDKAVPQHSSSSPVSSRKRELLI